ncbi:MAG: hypothetical protein LBS84_03330 [Clostridiales bacterium]|nr:hypothetical protein [Clostridiales bacterium]
MRDFTEVKISLTEAGNVLNFDVKSTPRNVKRISVTFPTAACEEIAANAGMLFKGADISVSKIQDPLTRVTAGVTEYLLKTKAEVIRMDIDDKLKDLPWELAKVEKYNSTWGRYFCAVRLAKGFKPNAHRTGESWRVFYDPEILSDDGLLYYQAVGCGHDEANIGDGGAKDAFASAVEENNILHIASHCERNGDRLLITKGGGFLNSQSPRLNASPRMVILDCCHSAETPLFSFRNYFREGCMVFVGHIGKMRVDNGYGSRFTKLFTRAFMSEKNSLANSIKAGRDTDNFRDYSAVVYVWEGVVPDCAKDDVFGILNEKLGKSEKFRRYAAIATVIPLVIAALLIVPRFFTATPPQAQEPSANAVETPSFYDVAYDDGIISGYVNGISPEEYGVITMILVGNQYYVKPYFDGGSLNRIKDDGSFSIQAYSEDAIANDLTAAKFSLFAVPLSFEVSSMAHASDYEAVADAAVLKLEHQGIER